MARTKRLSPRSTPRGLVQQVGRLADQVGLETLLGALADHCQERAGRLAVEYQDRQSARAWLTMAAKLSQAAIAAYDAGV